MSQLEFAHVTKKYGDLEALSAFTLSVQKGELISIVGPSGCGKTTALRVAAGFEKFDAGRLIVNGQNVELVPPQKRNMGMVFQSYSLFPHLTVAENIGFGLTIRKMEKKKRASVVSDMLDLVQRRPRRAGGRDVGSGATDAIRAPQAASNLRRPASARGLGAGSCNRTHSIAA